MNSRVNCGISCRVSDGEAYRNVTNKLWISVPFVKVIIFAGTRHQGKQLSPGGGGTPMRNRRGCSSEILNLTPKGDQSGRGLSKF